MKFKTFLEPFTELILSKTDFSYRKMRFFGRLPFFRNIGFDSSYESRLVNRELIDIAESAPSSDIVKEISVNGYSSPICITSDFLLYLEQLVSSTPFANLKTGEGKYFLDLQNLTNPSDAYLYNLDNPHVNNVRLNQFAEDVIKPIADAYLGAKSKVLNTQIWATFTDDGNTYNPDFGFHYDLDDYRFLKLFIYLTDVDDASGPHQIIEKSHKGNVLFRFFNRRLEEPLSEAYGSNVKVMSGKKGEGFFEDTLCYHKGTRPLKPRMILQIQYGISEFNAGKKD